MWRKKDSTSGLMPSTTSAPSAAGTSAEHAKGKMCLCKKDGCKQTARASLLDWQSDVAYCLAACWMSIFADSVIQNIQPRGHAGAERLRPPRDLSACQERLSVLQEQVASSQQCLPGGFEGRLQRHSNRPSISPRVRSVLLPVWFLGSHQRLLSAVSRSATAPLRIAQIKCSRFAEHCVKLMQSL